jgi:hypothetical protein
METQDEIIRRKQLQDGYEARVENLTYHLRKITGTDRKSMESKVVYMNLMAEQRWAQYRELGEQRSGRLAMNCYRAAAKFCQRALSA